MSSQSYDKMPLAELKKILKEEKEKAKKKIIRKIKKIAEEEDGKHAFIRDYIFYSSKDYKILKYINDLIEFMIELDGGNTDLLEKGEKKIELSEEGDLIKKVFKLLNKKIKVKEAVPYVSVDIHALFHSMSNLSLTAHFDLGKDFFDRIEVIKFGQNSKKCGRKNKMG